MNAAARIAELALAAGEYVRSSLAVELDGSAESLAFVDHYISKIGNTSDEVMALVAAALGAYFGEVAIARFGGQWRAEEDDPASWTVTLEAAPLRFHPVGMAAEAIRGQDLEDWDGGLRVPSAWEADVAEALESSGPVEADYYYSLTGRLETMERTIDLVNELRRREAETAAAAAAGLAGSNDPGEGGGQPLN